MARLAAETDPDAPAELEYRVHATAHNHPHSLAEQEISILAVRSLCGREPCLLWRFTEPRRDGMRVDGPGTMRIGVGRFNCDGTYSYFDETAAPSWNGHTDPARWSAYEIPTSVVAAAHDRGRHRIEFEDADRDLHCMPYSYGRNLSLLWGTCLSGFSILEIDMAPGSEDCKGWFDGLDYVPGGRFEVFAPMWANQAESDWFPGTSYCDFLGFGESGDSPDCLDEPRCLPNGPDQECPWVHLPDSLCPTSDAQRALFGCHLGDVDNVNGEAGYPDVRCSAEAPTTPRDPARGATDRGQCCDPLGMDADLPACNAFRIVYDFAAAAVQITDDTAGRPKGPCPP